MIELKYILLNSLFCYGMYISFSSEMVLSPFVTVYEKLFKPIDKYGEIQNKFAYYLSKPLYSCTICMASVWGIVFVHFSRLTAYGVISGAFLFHVVLVAGLNYLIAETVDSLKRF